MISFIPYYRKERKSVVIRIIVNGIVTKVIPTGIKLEPHQWDFDLRKVKAHPDKRIYNIKIENKVAELRLEIHKAEILGVSLTQDRVKRLAEGAKVTTDFFEHCERWISEKYANPGTRNAAMSDLRKVNGFAPSLQFGDIDSRWLRKYERYLRETLEQSGNTPWKAMKFVRTMLYDAQETIGKQIHNPFEEKEYKMPKYIDPEKDGLYLDEIDRIEKLLDEPHPVIIKLMAAKFLFMCYTGMRVSDAKRFTREEHLRNGERIVITSQKTGVRTNLKLYDRLERILERLEELPGKSISDQKLNQYLKVIGELAGINRIKLTTHIGRHSFGCFLAEMGLSEEEAQVLMGHKNKQHTRIYFKLRQPQMDRAVDKLNKREAPATTPGSSKTSHQEKHEYVPIYR